MCVLFPLTIQFVVPKGISGSAFAVFWIILAIKKCRIMNKVQYDLSFLFSLCVDNPSGRLPLENYEWQEVHGHDLGIIIAFYEWIDRSTQPCVYNHGHAIFYHNIVRGVSFKTLKSKIIKKGVTTKQTTI